MKFENYLQEHKDDLGSLKPSDNLWNQIDGSITESQGNKKFRFSKGQVVTFLALFVLAAVLVCASVTHYTAERKATQIAQTIIDGKIDEVKLLLTENKTSSRLKAINQVGFIQTDKTHQIPELLLNTVKTDPSLPVKFAALNALEDYVELENVRIGLIEILSNSEDDKLKIRVMSFLSQINEGRIEPFIEEIMRDDNRHEMWKSEAEEALENIKNL